MLPVLHTAPALGQSLWERQTTRAQEQIARMLRPEGYRATSERHALALNTGETATFTLTLQGGVTYLIAGVCDQDCAALQLALVAPTGYELEAERAATVTPLLRLTPRETGSVRLQVVMAGCRVNPCWLEAGTYRR